MRSIVISSGHGKFVRGARGNPVPPYLDEVDEARRVVDQVTSILKAAGVTVVSYHDDVSRTQTENLHRIVDFHNMHTRDLDVSVHFNASTTTATPLGTECLYYSEQELAAQVAAAVAAAAGLPNRGAKRRTELFFLNSTTAPAILIETCFVDSSADAMAYRENFDDICRAIATTIAGVPAPGPTPEPEPDVATVDIVISAKGNVRVTINGQPVEFVQPTPEIPDYQRNIIATMFYGTGAPGAYGIPIPTQDSPAKYVALPWRDNAGRRVRVYNRRTGLDAIGDLWDLGPWMIDDNYVATKTRPIAETCHAQNTPLPRGPNKGRIPNGAGIDISPALARAIGHNGLETVDFEFV